MTEAKLRRICTPTYTGTALLQDLPKTCQWANVLRTAVKPLETPAKVMGLTFCPGAVFTGPEGNGRHTHANALINNLIKIGGYKFALSIHGCDLDFEDPDELYELLDFLEKMAMGHGSLILLLDQPELSDHSIRFQNRLLRLQQSLLATGKNLYLILITNSVEAVAQSLLCRFPRYHCPKPTSSAISAFVDEMLKAPVPIHLEKLPKSELTGGLKNCSWKQLTDLHNQLLQLIVIHYKLKLKEFAPKGISEEQVYLDGLIKLPGKEIKAILASISAQNPVPPAPAYITTGGIPIPQPDPVPAPSPAPTPTGDDPSDPNDPTRQEILDSDDPIAAFMSLTGFVPDDEE